MVEIQHQRLARNRQPAGLYAAAALAILIEAGFGAGERWLAPRGLRDSEKC